MSTVNTPNAPGRPMPPAARPVPPAGTAAPPAQPTAAPAQPATPQAAVNPAPTISVPTGQPVAQTAPAPSGNGTPQKKRGRKKLADDTRIFHPDLNVDTSEQGGNKARNLVAAEPADFDPRKHLPLRRSDFTDDATFLEYKAAKLEKQAAEARAEAAELRKFGTKETQENARKLTRMVSKVDELTAALAAQNIDVEEFLNKIRQQQKEKEAKKAENAAPSA